MPLAERIHSARETFHDFTYKRVQGSWKEWEVVIWDEAINRRKYSQISYLFNRLTSNHSGLTVARIYGQYETRTAYHRMWKLLWDTVGKATGRPVKFKPFSKDGEGIRAILVDGNKEQVEACGDDLLTRNDSTLSGVSTTDVHEIVKYIIKLCMVHFDRWVIVILVKLNSSSLVS